MTAAAVAAAAAAAVATTEIYSMKPDDYELGAPIGTVLLINPPPYIYIWLRLIMLLSRLWFFCRVLYRQIQAVGEKRGHKDD